ncbi:hypothetical protein AAHH80_32880, partial [Burkholderia pseudomallei]
ALAGGDAAVADIAVVVVVVGSVVVDERTRMRGRAVRAVAYGLLLGMELEGVVDAVGAALGWFFVSYGF